MEQGQITLINDLEALLQEARNGEFGDFSNNKYPAPKMALAQKFEELRMSVISGKYD